MAAGVSIAITASLITDQIVWLARILVKPGLYVIAAGVTVLSSMVAGYRAELFLRQWVNPPVRDDLGAFIGLIIGIGTVLSWLR